MEWEYLVTSDRKREGRHTKGCPTAFWINPFQCPALGQTLEVMKVLIGKTGHIHLIEKIIYEYPYSVWSSLMWLCIISMWTLWPNRERELDKYFPLVFAVCKYGGGKTWGIWSHVWHQCLTMFDSWFWKSSMESCLIYLNWLQIACSHCHFHT